MEGEQRDVSDAELAVRVGGEGEREGKGTAFGGESEEMRGAGREGDNSGKDERSSQLGRTIMLRKSVNILLAPC